jgi:hypothetical protein
MRRKSHDSWRSSEVFDAGSAESQPLDENITTAILNQATVMTHPQRWLLLLHQVPPSPPYLRAKILRRLKQIGALALKNSAYLLPDSEDALEDFQWLLKEIRSEGGEAWVLRTEAVAGLTDEEIRDAFRKLRQADYQELLMEAQASVEAKANNETDLRKLRKRYDEVSRIDFFGAPGKQEVERLMSEIERTLNRRSQQTAAPESGFNGRRWVTRRGIKIDRTACCWLIRRFIDHDAEFSFVDPNQYVHREGELRFDMFEGEFTHEGESCSFEVLAERFGLSEPPLRAIAEIVHDLDLKDARYGRPETAGIAALIEGLGVRHEGDAQRMAEGLVIFDALYARLRSTERPVEPRA